MTTVTTQTPTIPPCGTAGRTPTTPYDQAIKRARYHEQHATDPNRGRLLASVLGERRGYLARSAEVADLVTAAGAVLDLFDAQEGQDVTAYRVWVALRAAIAQAKHGAMP